jgi:hypothetical protein
VAHAKIEENLKSQAALKRTLFVSQGTLRKWYYDNIDIVDYAVRPFPPFPYLRSL